MATVPIETLASPGPLPAIEWFPSSNGRSAADPFGIVVDGRHVVLCETWAPGSKGTISTTTFEREGWHAKLTPALELPVHLSYPYVFAEGGEPYCVPEASGTREIALYRSKRFPHDWEKCATLVPGVGGIDSTIVRYAGKYWLFAGDIADAPDLKLNVWYADELFGPWRAHAQNPVKIDIRSSRGAGTPFFVDGSLYRPAQDCSRTYGGRIVINRITELTPTSFGEEVARIVEPDRSGPYADGLHTISRFGEYTLVDGKQRAFSTSRLLRFLSGRHGKSRNGHASA